MRLLRQNLLFACVGWIAGVLFSIVIGFALFPGIVGSARTTSPAATLISLALLVLIVSPAALLGGFVGGRILREGGQTSQLIMAAVVALFFTAPVGCISLWYLGG